MHEKSADPRVRFETMYWIDCTVCGPDADPPPPRYSTEAELWTTLLGCQRLRMDQARRWTHLVGPLAERRYVRATLGFEWWDGAVGRSREDRRRISDLGDAPHF